MGTDLNSVWNCVDPQRISGKKEEGGAKFTKRGTCSENSDILGVFKVQRENHSPQYHTGLDVESTLGKVIALLADMTRWLDKTTEKDD